ncbi:unnamed protein product [Linum trigynum]|uniref:Uncharacterized protein n=1 Tax=Linum trigynum TaxID=586398 RepID=A0AAV2GL76_9ROSI
MKVFLAVMVALLLIAAPLPSCHANNPHLECYDKCIGDCHAPPQACEDICYRKCRAWTVDRESKTMINKRE